MRVVSIRHKGLQRLWSRNDPRGLPPDQVRRVQPALAALAAAQNIRMLVSVPGWRLHELKGARAGTWSMSISGNWRLTFRPEKEFIHDIDLEGYH